MSRRIVIALSFVLCLGLVTPQAGWGQKPPPPTPPNPQAPVLNPFVPAGIQRGARLELDLTGTNLAGPTGLYLSFPGKATIPTEAKNGEDNAKLKVIIEAAADAPVGPHLVRLSTNRGMSNLRVFCVDDLPQVIENDKNRDRKTPQDVLVPGVVAGKADAEQSDWFRFTVAAGQRLSFDLLSRRLGSQMDGQLSIYDAKTGREIAHDNDSPGCQNDPRLSFVFKEAGDYLVEVRDVLYRGGADFFYRLRIGDFPLATTPVPMAGKRGDTVRVEFAGPSVDGAAPVDVSIPSDPAIPALWVVPRTGGPSGWPVVLAASSLPELTEKEPNSEPAKAQRLTVPCGVTGRLSPSGDVDFYLFAAKKGEKVRIDVDTLELHSPTLVYLVVKNAKTGAEVAKTNPAGPPPADQRVEFTAADDGDYLVEVQHLNLVGGASETYHLSVVPAVAGFDALMTLERFDVSAGSIAPLPITINRRGYAGPIDLELVGAPGLSGKATVKAGQNTTVLVVTAGAEETPGPRTATILARAKVDKQEVTQAVSMKPAIGQSMSGLAYPPLPWFHTLALAVKPRAPFALDIAMDAPRAVPGAPATVKVSVRRDAGFEEPIELTPPVGLPPGVPPVKLGPIAKDKNELTFKLDVNAKVPVGEYQVLVGAKAKFKGSDISASAPPLNLVVGMPFDLKLEPAAITLKPGEKAKVKVSATRHGGYKGPIALEFRKLPAGVTAGKATLNPDQSTLEVDIAAAPTAGAAEVKDADILGTATAMGNLQNPSPPVVIRVEKK